MSVFLLMMIIGGVGMLLMALPGLLHTGHVGAHSLHAPAGSTHSLAAGHHAAHGIAGNAGTNWLRFIPSPRVVFSILALWGAFGHILHETLHQATPIAGGLGLVCALIVNHIAIRPLWKALMKLEGVPSSPLEKLILQEAAAVTPFRNGRGVVAVERDGRTVQFTASLPDMESGRLIKVGDRLQIEAVDEANERVTVTIK